MGSIRPLAPLPRSREFPQGADDAGESERVISRWLSPSPLAPMWDPGSRLLLDRRASGAELRRAWEEGHELRVDPALREIFVSLLSD